MNEPISYFEKCGWTTGATPHFTWLLCVCRTTSVQSLLAKLTTPYLIHTFLPLSFVLL